MQKALGGSLLPAPSRVTDNMYNPAFFLTYHVGSHVTAAVLMQEALGGSPMPAPSQRDLLDSSKTSVEMKSDEASSSTPRPSGQDKSQETKSGSKPQPKANPPGQDKGSRGPKSTPSSTGSSGAAVSPQHKADEGTAWFVLLIEPSQPLTSLIRTYAPKR